MDHNIRQSLTRIYTRLFKAFGPQYWWPGETRTEIIIGAILTQNTNWVNVQKALTNLKRAKLLNFTKLQKLPMRKLATLIKPSGYYNIKAKRLKNFVQFYQKEFGRRLAHSKTSRTKSYEPLRQKLLSVNGIGPETADSILLYAFDKPIFVVDAYTKRVLSRHGLIEGDATYEHIQALFMDNLTNNVKTFNEFHALLVKVGKEFCKPKPVCTHCPLKGL